VTRHDNTLGTRRSHRHGPWPRVSVIIPVLNEERYIGDCLRTILAQDYPRDLMEILVVDGMSTDHTCEIVQSLAREDNRIRLLLSPQRRTPFSMNIGVAAATGEVLVRVDGHSVVGTDHVRRLVVYLLESRADHVGGVMRATGRTYVQQTIALAMSSPFGVGTARFRYTDREQDIDTVPFGAYHRETVVQLGGFDERFLIGQDSELDYRIIRNGGRVRVTPAIHTDYYCRASLRRLAQQYFYYGKAKAYMLHKHGSLPSPRALAPAALLTFVGALAAAAPFSRVARRVLAPVLAAYSLGCLAAGIAIAAQRGWRHAALLPATLATLHISHGAGFLSALPAVLTPRPAERLRGSLHASAAAVPAAGALSDMEIAS
jgi:succinoglycan biosynthesis protein ExoA